MAKSNKRIKKKQETKKIKSALEQRGYSSKKQKRLSPESRKKEVQKIKKAERQKQWINSNRETLLKSGIPLSIITTERLDRKSVKDLTPKQISEIRRRGEKLDQLKAIGIPYKDAKQDLRLSWDKLNAKYNNRLTPPERHKTRGTTGAKKQPSFNPTIKLTGSSYLYIGYADIDGFIIDDLRDVSDARLKQMIRDRVKEAAKHPDDSGGFRGVFIVKQGSKSDMEYAAKVYYDRQYSMNPQLIKMTNDSYSKITVSNKFSQRNYWEMIYTCINQMKNSDVTSFIDDMEYYCSKNNFPFMQNLKK